MLSNALKQHKVTVTKPENMELVKALLDPLGRGEAEAIAIASTIKPDYIVLDDRLARRKAQTMGLNVIGTLRILGLIYKKNLLSLEELLDSLNALNTIGFHVSEQVIQEYIKSLEKT
jgi:predicted nucleic acid-binding protein